MAWSPVAHRYWTAYERHGRQAAARPVSAAGVAGSPAARAAARTPEVGGRERVRVAERPHRDGLDGPRPEAGHGARAAPAPPASRCRRSGRCDRRPAPPPARRTRRAVIAAARGRAAAASAAGSGTAGSGRRRDRRPARRTRPPGGPRACAPRRSRPAGRAPRAARTPSASTVRGTRRPGALPTSGASARRRESRSAIATGSASRSSSRRHRLIALARSRRSVRRSWQLTWSGCGPQRDDAVAVRQPQGAPVGAVAPLLDAGHARSRPGGRTGCPAASGARNGSRSDSAPAAARGVAAAGPVAQLAGGEGEHLAHGVVERPDAREPGRERDVAHRQRGGLDQQPGGLRALGPGQGQRPGAELGQQLALDLPDAVAEAAREGRARRRGP